MLRTNVIASSINNLTDARYFAAWGVYAIGFNLQEVSVMQVNGLKDWISGPKIIGQFSSIQNNESIQDVANNLALDLIQLDPIASSEWNFSSDIIREVIFENLGSELPEMMIIKSGNPSFDIKEHIKKLKDLCRKSKCFLDLNIDLENLDLILDEIQPEGIVLRGGDEEKVGFKSYDELDEIMEALDQD